jgi:hypothetical protein
VWICVLAHSIGAPGGTADRGGPRGPHAIEPIRTIHHGLEMHMFRNSLKLFAAAIGTAVVLAPASVGAQPKERFVTIGTGGQTGVYYVVGQSICSLVNRNTKEHGIKCTAPSTGGSVANINSIRAG